MSDKKSLFSGIASKISILMGGAIAVTGAQASVVPATTTGIDAQTFTVATASTRKPLPAKLILKQQKNGFHVKAHDKALLPTKVVAYRWRSVSWETLETFFRQ